MQNKGTIIAGKYELGKEIGKGGMSRVYIATDTRLNKVWAVKKVDKTISNSHKALFINNLRKEVKLMEGLNYVTIPRIVDIIEDTKTIYIVMDFVEGESLDKILKIKGRQNEDDVIDWGKQICETLIYLHSLKNPVVHRDIKPANIILQPGVQNSIKILDFGIAEEITSENSVNKNPGGTPGYMAPEQEIKGAPYDIRSDIYSFGATLHHLLTGKIPKKNKPFVKLRSVTGRVSENTEGLEYVIEKCLRTNPDERYQNCNELLYDLNHLPNLSKDHRRKLLNHVTTFSVVAGLAVVFAITSVLGNFGYRALAKGNQMTYAENIYSQSNDIVQTLKINQNDSTDIEENIKEIEKNLDESKKLSDDDYTNASVFLVYSVAMWNIYTSALNSGTSTKENEEQKREFVEHMSAFSNNIAKCTDSKELAVCTCTLNAYNILFMQGFSNVYDGLALNILENTNNFIKNNNSYDNLELSECYEKSNLKSDGKLADFLSGYSTNSSLTAPLYELAKALDNSHRLEDSEKQQREPSAADFKNVLETCLKQYKNAVKIISDTELNSEKKLWLYISAVNFIENHLNENRRDNFRTCNISEKELTDNNSLYSELVKAVEVLSKENPELKSQSENKLDLDELKREIDVTYHPTVSLE